MASIGKAILLICLLVICSCSANANANELPSWVLNSQVPGYITGLGSAKFNPNKKHALKRQKMAARLKAQADIGKQIKIYINSVSEQRHSSDGTSQYNQKTVETSIVNYDASKAVVLQQWTDPNDSTLYILMGIKIAQ